MRRPMTKKEDRRNACLEDTARVGRKLEAMERALMSYKPGAGGWSHWVAVEVRQSI
jgi:hypothetical protein